MSCSDGSYDLSMNMVLNCAAKAWIPGNFLIPIMTCYQIPLRQFLNLIKTYYQIVPALAAQSVLKLLADDDKDDVRIKVIPSFKQKFRRQMQQTNHLQDDFFLAQLVLNFLKKHGDQLVKEKPGPKKRFASTLHLVQHVLKQK
eukprot:s4889_g4.t1